MYGARGNIVGALFYRDGFALGAPVKAARTAWKHKSAGVKHRRDGCGGRAAAGKKGKAAEGAEGEVVPAGGEVGCRRRQIERCRQGISNWTGQADFELIQTTLATVQP